MIKWMRKRQGKGLQIVKLQQALHAMAEKANLLDETIQNLQQKLQTREVDTKDKDFLERNNLKGLVRRQKEEIKNLHAENDRLKRKINWIIDEPLPAEFAKDIDMHLLPQRVVIFLKNENLLTYMDLIDKTEAEMLRTPNFGVGSLNDLKAHLRDTFPKKDQVHFACLAMWSY